MATTIGDIEWRSGVDSRGLRRDLRRQEKEIEASGTKAGNAFEKSFNKSGMSKIFDDLQKRFKGLGDRFRSTFDSLGARAQAAFRRIRGGSSDVVRDFSNMTGKFTEFQKKLGSWGGHELDPVFNNISVNAKRFKDTIDSAGESVERFTFQAKKSVNPLRRLGEAWRSLGHNTKQWTLIITAVLAGMSELAVLSSAAGGGALILGGALAGAVVGAGAFALAISGLVGDIEKVPAAVRPAAKAFKDLGGPLRELRDSISVRAFKDSEATFRSLGDTIRRITPSFGPLADVIGDITDSFAEWAASEEGISLITGLIEKSAPIFDSLARSVGKLGQTLLVAFNNPRFQEAITDMLTGLSGLLDQFDAFVRSEDFTTWIDNTSRIMGDLGSLIGTTAGMISDLVTPEAIENTSKFLRNLEDFMPHLGDLLEILGNLDPFGLLAEALATIGDVLEPLAGPLKDLATGLNDIVEIAIDEWGESLRGVAEALAPVVQALADMVKDVDPATVRLIADALLFLGGAFVAIKAATLTNSAVASIGALFATLGKGGGILKKFPIGKLAGIAGGLAILGAAIAAFAIPDSFWEDMGIESNIVENIGTGALIGARFGPIGIAIGAGLGYITSLITDFEGTLNDIGGLIGLLIPDEHTMETALSENATWWERYLGITQSNLNNLGGITQGFFTGEYPAEFEKFYTTLGLGWETMWNDLWTGAETWLNDILTSITTWAADVQSDLLVWAQGVLNNWDTLWSTVFTVISDTWTNISSTVKTWVDTVNRNITNFANDVRRNWESFWSGVRVTVVNTWYSVSTTISTKVSEIKTAVGNFVNDVRNNWNNFWGGLANAVANAWNTVVFWVNTKSIQVRVIFGAMFANVMGGWNSFWGSLPNAVSGAWSRITGIVDGIVSAVRRAVNSVSGLSRAAGSFSGGAGGGISGRFASGGVLAGPRRILAGEDGPEAIVPLRRSLNRVDPSVRALSAIAQGMTPHMAGGGTVGGGRSITFAPNSIVVYDASDARRVAIDVANQIADRVAS